MAKSSQLRVMLSSRCNDEFPAGSGKTLTQLRTGLKAEIERMEIAGKPAFEVWINEDAPPAAGTDDSWEACLKQVADCDILIVLSNGNAGWSTANEGIGICHAELMKGLAIGPGKVRLIDLGSVPITKDGEGRRNQRFQDEVSKQSLFRGGTVTTAGQLKQRVFEALHDAVIGLARAGVRDAAKGKHHSGAALDWTRMDFAGRAGVDGPFGRYIADNVQKIQVAFLTHCVDETSTRHAVQRFIEWLKQTNEEALLAKRAVARANIVKVIAKEAAHA